MKTKKQILQRRLRRLIEHRDRPNEPVDAATLLHKEAERLSHLGGPVANRMGWAMRLAAAKLEAWDDMVSTVRYRKVQPDEKQ